MHLIQLLLPLYDNRDIPFAKSMFNSVRSELTGQFGGVTAYVRSPAVGAWEDDAGRVQRDDIVLLEVMAESLDRNWWSAYRKQLEERFAQDQILIRSTAVDCL